MPNDRLVNTTTDSSQENASIAALAGGGFVAVWTDSERDYGTSGFDGFTGIYGQRFDEQGRKVGVEFQVHQREGGQQFNSRVVGLANGGFAVGWTGEVTDDEGSYELGLDTFQRRFDALGNPTTPELRLNAPSNDDHRLQDLLVLGDGSLAVTYVRKQLDTNWSLVQRRFDPQGVALTGEVVIDTDLDVGSPAAFVRNTPGFRMTLLQGGGYGAAWWEFAPYPALAEVYYGRFNAAGQRIGEPTLLSTLSPDDAEYPELATLAGGNVAVAWTVENDDDLDDEEVWVRVVSPDGVPLGAAVRVNLPTREDDRLGDVVALPDGGFLVTFVRWDEANSDFPYDYYAVQAQRFSATGSVVGGPISVSEFVYEDAVADQALLLPSGGLVVTWTGGATIEEDVYASFQGGGTFADDSFALLVSGPARGFDGDDQITGTLGADQIAGDDGNDQLIGRGGPDRIWGGTGNDVLGGADGADWLEGGAGNDTIYGGNGADRLVGGPGADWLYGAAGGDVLQGGAGPDRYVFRSTSELGPGETILGVERFDRIVLFAIDADPGTPGDQAFRYVWRGAFTGRSGEVRLADQALQFDFDGNRLADASIALPGIDWLGISTLIL